MPQPTIDAFRPGPGRSAQLIVADTATPAAHTRNRRQRRRGETGSAPELTGPSSRRRARCSTRAPHGTDHPNQLSARRPWPHVIRRSQSPRCAARRGCGRAERRRRISSVPTLREPHSSPDSVPARIDHRRPSGDARRRSLRPCSRSYGTRSPGARPKSDVDFGGAGKASPARPGATSRRPASHPPPHPLHDMVVVVGIARTSRSTCTVRGPADLADDPARPTVGVGLRIGRHTKAPESPDAPVVRLGCNAADRHEASQTRCPFLRSRPLPRAWLDTR